MGWRAGGTVMAFLLLSACAEDGQLRNFDSFGSAPANEQVNKDDPAFRFADLKQGLPLGRLQGMYGYRLVYVTGDPSYQQYVVEPSYASPALPTKRDRLVMWVIDGHLATWAVEKTSGPVALASTAPAVPGSVPPPPPGGPATASASAALPPPPSRTRASAGRPGASYTVQIAARRSEADARAAIDEMRARYAGLLAQRGALIVRVSLPQGIFYRAVVGPFASPIQANDLCGQLRAAGAECFVRPT